LLRIRPDQYHVDELRLASRSILHVLTEQSAEPLAETILLRWLIHSLMFSK
jgi:hypothetical protein